MKIVRAIIISLFFVVSSEYLFSQEDFKEIEAPELPELIEVHDFDFKLSKKQEQFILQRLNSKIRSELQYIKSVEEERYWELLRESQFRGFEFPFIDKRDKEIHERNKQILENEIITESLALKYEKSSASERGKIKTELMKTLNILFDLKEEEKRMQVRMLENELKELKQKLSVRAKNKSKIIELRFNELTDTGEYLEWD